MTKSALLTLVFLLFPLEAYSKVCSNIQECQQAIKYGDSYSTTIDAIKDLGEMGPDAIPVLKGVCIKHKCDDIHLEAVIAISNIKAPSATAILNDVLNATGDCACSDGSLMSKAVLLNTIDALVDHLPLPNTVVASLGRVLEKSQDQEVMGRVTKALIKIGRPAVPVLTQSLKSSNQSTRTNAVNTLKALGPSAKGATTDLVALVIEKDGLLQYPALDALQAIGPASIEPLVKVLNNDNLDVTVTVGVMGALQRYGTAAKAAVPILTGYLGSKVPELRQSATQTLGAIGAASSIAVPSLLKMMETETNTEARKAIVIALGEIGPAAKTAVPMLINAWEKDPESQQEIAEALGRIGPSAKDAVPFLIQAASADSAWKHTAILALGGIGASAKDAVPVLMKMLDESSDDNEQICVITALGGIGASSKDAIPKLEGLSKFAQDPHKRATAKKALREIQRAISKKNS